MAIEARKNTSFERNWFTLISLIGRDFKLKYRRSVLGIVWSVLNPLLMMCVLSAVFSFFLRFEGVENYPLYLILGNTLFGMMSESTSSAMTSIIDSSSLIKKVRIEKMIFPLEKVLFAGLNFCFSLIAVAAVMIFFRIVPTIHILLFPILLAYVLIFSAGLSLLLSALAVFFRDVCHLWSVVITAWTYATPLFYPASILPEWMMTFEQFNPMYHYVTYFRNIMLWGQSPSLFENAICLGFAVFTFLLGLWIFRKFQKRFILYV